MFRSAFICLLLSVPNVVFAQFGGGLNGGGFSEPARSNYFTALASGKEIPLIPKTGHLLSSIDPQSCSLRLEAEAGYRTFSLHSETISNDSFHFPLSPSFYSSFLSPVLEKSKEPRAADVRKRLSKIFNSQSTAVEELDLKVTLRQYITGDSLPYYFEIQTTHVDFSKSPTRFFAGDLLEQGLDLNVYLRCPHLAQEVQQQAQADSRKEFKSEIAALKSQLARQEALIQSLSDYIRRNEPDSRRAKR